MDTQCRYFAGILQVCGYLKMTRRIFTGFGLDFKNPIPVKKSQYLEHSENYLQLLFCFFTGFGLDFKNPIPVKKSQYLELSEKYLAFFFAFLQVLEWVFSCRYFAPIHPATPCGSHIMKSGMVYSNTLYIASIPAEFKKICGHSPKKSRDRIFSKIFCT